MRSAIWFSLSLSSSLFLSLFLRSSLPLSLSPSLSIRVCARMAFLLARASLAPALHLEDHLFVRILSRSAASSLSLSFSFISPPYPPPLCHSGRIHFALRYPDIGTAGARSLAEGLKINTHLLTLECVVLLMSLLPFLSRHIRTQHTHTHTQHTHDTHKRPRPLRAPSTATVSLGASRLGDEGALLLADALRHNRTITLLS